MVRNGFTLAGQAVSNDGDDHVVEVDLYIDGELDQSVGLPTEFRSRKNTPFWRFGLQNRQHTLRFVVKNPSEHADFLISRLVYYGPDD